MFEMAKWTTLVASLKQKSYHDASKDIDVIEDYDNLQDALQVIPFKALNVDVPESLSILVKLYTKFLTLTNNKEEGRLIIRHVFKVDMLLKNLIRTEVEERVLHGNMTENSSLDMNSVDQITQITWSMDCSIVKDFMSDLTRLNSAFKHVHKRTPRSLDVGMTSDEFNSDLQSCLTRFNSVIQHIESLTYGGVTGDPEESANGSSLSVTNVEDGFCRGAIEWISRRCSFNKAVLDVMEPYKGNIERGPILLQSLSELVQSDEKVLEIMTELSIDMSSSCYRAMELEKILKYFIISYKSVLSAVAPFNESSSSDGQRSSSKTVPSDSGLVDHGLKIEVNGSPFRRRFDTRRPISRDPRERREPLRTHSHRELRSGDLVNRDSKVTKDDEKLKEKLALREKQLNETRSLVKNLKKREEQLLERLTEQAKNNLIKSEKFENLSQDTPRVAHLVRQYDDLYSQLRLEALDDLDNIKTFDGMERSDEIKSQITFAIITVSFHLAQQEIKNRREKIFDLLNMDDGKSLECGNNSSLRNEISLQFGRSASKIDLQHVVDEVCNGLCTTMFDFPELQSCQQLQHFVEACVRFSWSICAHVPPLTITYASTNYTSSLHSKSCNSDEGCNIIKYHVWPALMESETMLYKGIVTT